MKNRQLGFYFDPDRCVQCHACELACKSLHQVEFGIGWRRIVSLWRGVYPEVANRTVSLACMHCGEPACRAVCPRAAIEKRSEDGIVVVHPERCIGCHSCLWVCPFGAVRFGSDGRMQKCNSCLELVREGEEPACVATCPAEALHFGPLEKMADLAAAKAARKVVDAAGNAASSFPAGRG
jgi:anaerobic dimethyl sulfoxide reductase subunit B (iron-sulfur subunit)